MEGQWRDSGRTVGGGAFLKIATNNALGLARSVRDTLGLHQIRCTLQVTLLPPTPLSLPLTTTPEEKKSKSPALRTRILSPVHPIHLCTFVPFRFDSSFTLLYHLRPFWFCVLCFFLIPVRLAESICELFLRFNSPNLMPSPLAAKQANDPHEKPGRYRIKKRNPSLLSTMKESFMSQSQKTRWFKTGAIVFAVLCLFYWLSPSGVNVSSDGEAARILIQL